MGKIPKASEAQISKAIMEYLAARHIFSLRMNSGMRVGEYKGKQWAIHMHEPGTADILAFPQWTIRHLGVTDKRISIFWLEVKSATGKQTEVQKSFQAQVEAEGHRYAVVRSVEDVEALLR